MWQLYPLVTEYSYKKKTYIFALRRFLQLTACTCTLRNFWGNVPATIYLVFPCSMEMSGRKKQPNFLRSQTLWCPARSTHFSYFFSWKGEFLDILMNQVSCSRLFGCTVSGALIQIQIHFISLLRSRGQEEKAALCSLMSFLPLYICVRVMAGTCP